jgi:hypothetical protein
VYDRPTKRTDDQNIIINLSNIIDIEERIWSLMYGIKGDVDITIDANLSKKRDQGKIEE